jgi:hypothetical protein
VRLQPLAALYPKQMSSPRASCIKIKLNLIRL